MYVGWCRKTHVILAVHEDYRVIANILWVNNVKDFFGIDPLGENLFKSWPNVAIGKLASESGTRHELIVKCVGKLKAIIPPDVDKFQLEIMAAGKV